MKTIIIATKNNGKAKEFKQFFKAYDIKAMSLLDLDTDIADVEETGSTFEENAALKAETIASILNTPVLADDSGLVIDALNGDPGVHSARYAAGKKSDQANIDKVMQNLLQVQKEKRTARFVTVLAVSIPGEQTFFKKGYCEGMIAMKQAGTEGFGYDPIFIPEGYEQTMGEISAEEKNKISHRSDAINQLSGWIKEYNKKVNTQNE